MSRKSFRILIIGLAISLTIQGQVTNENEKLWDSTDRITELDFKLAVDSPKTYPCFAQFSTNYSVNGFDFLSRNFNQKVKNIMITNASWIDAGSKEKKRLIRYQQILFDLSEKYTRIFRKQLLVNKKKIAKGPQIAEDINNEIFNKFSIERASFEKESNGGVNESVLTIWEDRIQTEIQELNEFRFDNTKKIKIK